MPELNWVGKDKVITHHLDVPYRVLDRQYSFDKDGQHEADNGSENMIIHGDNLEALKALLPRYEGKVDCIYIDPPYNTGNEGWVYNDAVNDPRIKKWIGEVVGKEGDDLSRHDKWLCMMYPRLRLLQRLLAPTGPIFISIDDHEQASLKLIVACRRLMRSWIRIFRPTLRFDGILSKTRQSRMASRIHRLSSNSLRDSLALRRPWICLDMSSQKNLWRNRANLGTFREA